MSKPQLHVTGLNMLFGCGVQYERRYVQGERLPPAVAMLVGTGVDNAVSVNLQHKIDSGELLETSQVTDAARDALMLEWDKEGALLHDEELAKGEKQTRGDAVDKAVRLAKAHHEQCAPRLKPTHVQRKWTLTMHGQPVDLAGTIDVQEGYEFIRDTKTTQRFQPDAVHTSDQLTMYALAVNKLENIGDISRRVALDTCIDYKRGPEVKTTTSYRNITDTRALLNRVAVALQAMRSGIFLPARSDDWRCSRRWCGYFKTCKYASNRR